MVQQIIILAIFAIFAIAAARIVPYKHFVAEAKRPQDPCRICDHVIRRAEANGNITTSAHLLRQLERECIKLANTDGDDAAISCITMVQTN
uniref:Saposin B-type domain-containing protein n=1 Tax=Panagrolaimus sp. ES5 TaxID=591445 RepID=A0AC34GC59_9BILA